MVKKPTAQAPDDSEVSAEVKDTLLHDGEPLGPGDKVILPRNEAVKLRALGVVAFDDDQAEA